MTDHAGVWQDAAIVATGISEQEYLEQYAHDFCEYVNGAVIQLSPVHVRHDVLTQFFIILLRFYLEKYEVGQLRQAPFVMRFSATAYREPDLMMILNEHMDRLSLMRMNGGADIVIEIVSFESSERDYGIKRAEYERYGVGEYWLVDPLETHAVVHTWDAAGKFVTQEMREGIYTTPLLPHFAL